ncbi:MAG: DNA topoisomerase IB [Acidobacteria bacterium]|nr:DNA topoisomerase IB [Acidobacteriota bacterium]
MKVKRSGKVGGPATTLRLVTPAAPPEALEAARAAGLRYTADRRPGIRRVRSRSSFRFLAPDGRAIRDKDEVRRILALVIPPAWTDIWICTDPRGHLQATGRDARGRKQYRYHARWREVRDETKYYRMIAFARALPAIRRRAAEDLRCATLTREQVLAAVVCLLEKTLIRVGNDEYAKQNRSFGLTTLKDGHVRVQGARVRFSFRGKSGVEHEVDLEDRGLARIVKACRDLPGYDLFQYLDENGERHTIGSADVNAYLKEISGEEFTSKDFRTWAGTVLAAEMLRELGRCDTDSRIKKNIVEAVESVAGRLGNTRAVCRKCYIHPAVLDSYTDGSLLKAAAPRLRRVRAPHALTPAEAAVLNLLERCNRRELKRHA